MSDQNAALFDKLDGFYVTKSEHDWLERHFSNMTEKEKILFQGAMELEKPQEIGHVMRIASQLDCYDLFYGAGDEAALGKFVMESRVFLGCRPSIPECGAFGGRLPPVAEWSLL